MFKFFVKNYQV